MSRIDEVLTYTDIVLYDALYPNWQLREEIQDFVHGFFVSEAIKGYDNKTSLDSFIEKQLSSPRVAILMMGVNLFFDCLDDAAVMHHHDKIKEAQTLDEKIELFIKKRKKGI